MNAHEVPEPILNSPFEEPQEHWWITEHDPPERRAGRRPAMYFYRRPGRESSPDREGGGTAIGLKLVNRIRAKLAEWRPLALKGEAGVTRTTMELLRYWHRDGDGSELSHERFAALLAEIGCGLSPGQIAQMAYAVQRLLPLLPVALSAGMDQQEVERIRALDQAAGALWAERQIDSQAEYDLTFAALCRRYDGEDWDLGSLRRALETEVAERLGASIQSARMEMDARLRRQRHSPLGRPQRPVRLISKESDP